MSRKRRKNLICNFRAPDSKHYKSWQSFVKSAEERGMTVCRIVLPLCDAWRQAMDCISQNSRQIVTPTQIVNLYQQIEITYNVGKLRREPVVIFSSRKKFSRTIWRLMVQAYIKDKARKLGRSFTYRDFLEFGHDSYRKQVFNLKKQGEIQTLLPRSNPATHILSEWATLYPTMVEEHYSKTIVYTQR